MRAQPGTPMQAPSHCGRESRLVLAGHVRAGQPDLCPRRPRAAGREPRALPRGGRGRELPLPRRPARAGGAAATGAPVAGLPRPAGSGRRSDHERADDHPCRGHPHRLRLGRAVVGGGAAALRRRPPSRQVRAAGAPRRHAAPALRDRGDDRAPRGRGRARWRRGPSSASATASTTARRATPSPAARRRASARSRPGATGSGSPATTTPRAPRSPGARVAEVRLGALAFRHRAAERSGAPEVSGHYHPKLRLPVRRRTVSRPCFLYDARRLILPAFGAYTGGLRAEQPGPRAAARRPTPARSSPATPA